MLSDRDTLHAALAQAPQRFGFFEALRRLQQAEPQRPRIGTSARPADDAVRLGQPPSLAFAPSTLAGFEPREGRPPLLQTHAFGLFGPNGPLPSHVTEYAHERAHNAGDTAMASFADLFHHRMLSLFFRAWAENQPAVDADRPDTSRYAEQIGSLVGIGRPALRERDALPDDAKRHHAGHLGNHSRHAEGLRSMIADLFGMPVAIEEFVGEWLDLPEADQCRLGNSPDTGRLGTNLLIGRSAWCAQHKFRIRLGPMGRGDYEQFLPGGELLERLQALVRNYLGAEKDFELALVLRHDEVPSARLAPAERLGWTSWLGPRPEPTDACDLRLDAGRIDPIHDSRSTA